MERVELRAERRTVQGKKVKRLRAENLIPAVVYGPDTPAQAIQAQERELFNALQEAGSTTLINLYVDDEADPTVVLAREIQRHIITGRVQHVDFYQVRLTEKVKTTPRLEIVGVPPAVESGMAVMIHAMSEVEVECLPTDLIHSIPVDVSGLETLADSILVSDLPIPDGVTILADPSDVVISLVTTRILEEEEEEEEILVEGEEEEEADEEAQEED